MTTDSFVHGIRRVARIWSALSLMVVGVFAVGEILGGAGPGGPTPSEWLGLALWPIGVVLGLIVAWHHEESGGALALASLVAFYAWDSVGAGRLPQGPFVFLVAAPALLFFVAGFLSHHHHHGPRITQRFP
ncbi:MAG TPA: hypothetical protein VMT20_09535 [Terriglobia bacterium]|nr:hypothetical protein [Terriglobia bacterium]